MHRHPDGSPNPVRRWLVGLIALFAVPAFSQYVTLSGVLQAANGLPAANYTLSFTINQWGFIGGSGVVVNTTTYCGTDSVGNVVGVASPAQQSLNTPSYSGGSLAAANYFVEFAWYTSTGAVTQVSPESTAQLTATGNLQIAPPSNGVPAGVSGMKVYIGTSSGAETYQGQTTGSNVYTQSVALVSGASPPASNTTICKQVANDAIWPVGTGYTVSMTDPSGNTLPGYPMMWQLLGPNTTINLSNGLPYYHGVVTFPVPILATPQNHALQSILGPLSLSGYPLLNVSSINNVIYPCLLTGATSDIQLNSALAMVSAGGTVDAHCYAATQPTIASTVTVGNNQTLLLDPATIFRPASASTNMFNLQAGGIITGLSVNTTNVSYTGQVLTINTAVADGTPTKVENANLVQSSTSTSSVSGTGIALIAPLNGIAFVRFDHVQTVGFTDPLLLDASGGPSASYFVNGNIFTDFKTKNGANCVHLKTLANANGAVVAGNLFSDLSCQEGPASQKSIWLDGSTLYGISYNTFPGVQLWDYAGNTFYAGAASNNNTFIGQMEDASTNDAGSGNQVISNTYTHNAVNLAPLVWNYPGGVEIKAIDGSGLNLVDANGTNTWNIQPFGSTLRVVLSGSGSPLVLTSGGIGNSNGVLLPTGATGYTGTGKVVLSTGTGYSGSCASTTTLTVVDGIITGCS